MPSGCSQSRVHATMRNAPMNTANGSASEQHASHDTQQILPVPNATTPYWRTQLHWIDEHRSTEELPVECDVVIIGAGMSGVATAYHLCDQAGSTKPSIVMLEARQVCSGATGRNGVGAAGWQQCTLLMSARVTLRFRR